MPYWLVGRAGRFALCAACQVERAGEGLRVRFFGLAWGWPELLNFEPRRLRIPSVPCTKLSSPHNERAQEVLLTIVFDQKLPQNIHFPSQLSAPIKTGLRKKYSKTLYFDENTPKYYTLTFEQRLNFKMKDTR